MLRSSVGFHTMSLSLRLTRKDTEQLIKHFYNYCKQTGIIRMLIVKELPNGQNDYKEYSPKFCGTSLILPHKLEINFSGKNRGIKWTIRSYRRSEVYKEYGIEVTINPKILGGTDTQNKQDYITVADCNDMLAAVSKYNRISQEISPLLLTFNQYNLKRIDRCINLCVDELAPGCLSEQIMNLMKRGDIPPRFKEKMKYNKKLHRLKAYPDSFYLVSKSVTINCYLKSKELQDRMENHRTTITQDDVDEASDIIRFEIQTTYRNAIPIFKLIEKNSSLLNQYYDWLGYPACLKQINHYYKMTIGAGDWYSLSIAQKIIEKCGYNKQKRERLLNVLRKVSQCRSLAEAKAKHQGADLRDFKQTVKDLAGIGINPVTIPREWGFKRIPNLLHKFNDMDLARLACSDIPLI